MLNKDSILRRVPALVDPKQALFIDGIRHSAEIIDLAYGRLKELLTHTALNVPSSDDLPSISANAFLDAWAIVDAIDRFRMLYTQMPGMTLKTNSLQEVIKSFRDLRNVADHLAQRADFVISRNGSALGVLSWMTGFNINPLEVWHCTLKPGTVRESPSFIEKKIVSTLDWPTDNIILQAGGYEGNLSSVRQHIGVRISHFEEQLEKIFSGEKFNNSFVASDVFTRKAYRLEFEMDC